MYRPSTILETTDNDGCVVRVAFPTWRTGFNHIEKTMESFNCYVKKGYHISCQRSYCEFGEYCRLKDTQHTLECHQVSDQLQYEPDTSDSKCILPPGILNCVF